MQISLRSQMIAGVAAVAATAVAITPIAQPDLTAVQRLSSTFELTAFANPVTALAGTLDLTAATLVDQTPLLDPADLFWPDSFYTADFGTLYAPSYFGWIPDLANQFSFGAISALINNVSGYTYAGLYAPLALVGGIATAAFNAPFALVAAAQLALAGDIPGAIAELQTQIIAPIQDSIGGVLTSVGYILDNVIANVQTVVFEAVPALVNGLTSALVGGVAFLVTDLITTATEIVTSISTGDIEGAWNAAVDGLLGPDGTLGNAVVLTTGIGIVQEVEYDEGPVLTVTNPSLRSVLTSEAQRLGDFSANGDGGILNDPFDPFAGVTPPAAAEAAVTAVDAAAGAEPEPNQADAAVERPVAGDAGSGGADTAASDTDSAPNAGGDSSPSASSGDSTDTAAAAAPTAASTGGQEAGAGADTGEKPVKQRSARKAAKAASASKG